MIHDTKIPLGIGTSNGIALAEAGRQSSNTTYKPCLVGGLRFCKSIAIGFAVLGFNGSVYAQANPGAQDAALVFQPSIQPPLNSPQGACLVKFDINTMGKTQNIRSNCSSEDFQTEAVRVVGNSIYSPQMLNGQPVVKTNMIVTLKFGQEISDVSQEPSPALTQQNIETVNPLAYTSVNASLNAIENEQMSEQIEQMSTELDTINCAKEAQKLAKSGGMLGGLGKLAKFAGYDDIADGINYYDKANQVLDKLSKKEKKLYEECMQKRAMSRDSLKRTSEVAKEQARIEAEVNRKPELALTAPNTSKSHYRRVYASPPIFPPRFLQGDNSGFCKVRFDVNEKGVPFNVRTTVCTSSLLSENSLISVRKSRYEPKNENGKAVINYNVNTTVRFSLHDENGQKLPFPAGF